MVQPEIQRTSLYPALPLRRAWSSPTGGHPGTGCGCGHSLKRDHASVSPMRWPRNIPWTTLPSGLAKHHWRVGLGPRTHGDSIARRRGDSVSWHQVSGRCLVRQLPNNGASRKPGAVQCRIEMPLTSIDRIVLSPWLPASVVESVKKMLKVIPGCTNLQIYRSSLVDNENWKRFAQSDDISSS